MNDFVDSDIWNTDIFTYLTFVNIYLIYKSLKTCFYMASIYNMLLKASICHPLGDVLGAIFKKQC